VDKETKIKKIRGVLKTFNREFAESYLDDKIPGWRELEPEWQSITRLSPGEPERWGWDKFPEDIRESFDEWRSADSSDDPLFNRAVEIVTREGKASTSFLQRHLQIGYNRAVRMIKSMEAEGIITQPDDLGHREILVGQELLQERGKSQEKLPAKVDLSNKELQVRIEDELKNLLEAIRASVDVYPEDLPQYQHETSMFVSDKPQEVSLEDYPNIHKLVKSRIVETLRKGGGTPPYESRRSEMFANGVTDFYKQSKDLTTKGYYDVNIISELGFRSVPKDLKEFMKDVGISGQRGLSRGLREVFRYFTGSFAEPGKAPITTAYTGRNPVLQEILESIPFLAPVGEGRYIIKNRLESDASDLGPVYEKYMNVKPGTRTLPEQMQLLEDTTGTGTVRSMIDPSRQVQPLETKQQNDIFRHLIRKFNEEGGLPKERPVDVAAIRSKFFYMKNHYAREAAIRRAVQDAEQAAKKAGPIREHEEKKKLEFQPDPQPEQVEEEIPEEELKRIPVPIKPKKAAKPSGTSSAHTDIIKQLNKNSEALRKLYERQTRKLLDPERTTAKTAEKVPVKKAEKVPVKKAEKVPTLTKKQAAAAAREKTFKHTAGTRTSTGELRVWRGRGEWGDPIRKTQAQLEKIRKEALEAADKKRQKREEAAKKAKKKPDPKGDPKGGPKGSTKGLGLFYYFKGLEHLWGAGSVTEKGEPLASLEDQMNRLT